MARLLGKYKYGENGELVKTANFNTSLMMTLNTLYPNDTQLTKKLIKTNRKFKRGDKLQKLYNTKDNSGVVRKVFREFFKLVLIDVLEGNCTFYFPGNSQAHIFVGNLSDKCVKSSRQKGYKSKFDLLVRDYKVPHLMYKFSKKSRRQTLRIYVHKPMFARFIDVANSGKKFSGRPKTMEHFMPEIHKRFDCITEKSLDRIVRYISQKLTWNLRRGEEVRMVENDGEIRVYRPLGPMHDEIMEQVVSKRKARIRNKELRELENKDNDTSSIS